jgi:hypothetical protein
VVLFTRDILSDLLEKYVPYVLCPIADNLKGSVLVQVVKSETGRIQRSSLGGANRTKRRRGCETRDAEMRDVERAGCGEGVS